MSMSAHHDVHLLNDTWSLYFHDPWSADWTMDSYVRVGDISSIEDFAEVTRVISKHLHQGMWFCFRESVFPCWDDPANIEGGCISMKLLKNDSVPYFERLWQLMLGENLLVDPDAWQHLNGISISPKKHFCIVKLWLGDPSINKADQFNIGTDYAGEIIYRSNRENITGNRLKVP
jgi:hypothetical protein